MPGLQSLQVKLKKMLLQLEAYAETLGYELTLGDSFRDPRLHGVMGVKLGYGHKNSCHKLRLAQDYNLFKDGKWLSKTEDFLSLGLFWESIGGTWGGRFADGNHFSLEYQGYK